MLVPYMFMYIFGTCSDVKVVSKKGLSLGVGDED
jgi:hypothetical protein